MIADHIAEPGVSGRPLGSCPASAPPLFVQSGESTKPRVVVIGGGFAGLAAARALSGADVDVVLFDQRNHHVFQPLLYQVAMSILSAADIAVPLRQLESRQSNLDVVLGEVKSVDLIGSFVMAECPGIGTRSLTFDYLVIATGVRPAYFGHEEFARHAPGLKTLADAERVRSKILSAFEIAELTPDPQERARQMTFVLVGAGPTGVELAASLAQMVRGTLRRNFRRIDPADAQIVLIDGAERVLPTFAASLGHAAHDRLEALGVRVLTSAKVEMVDEQGVVASGNRVQSATILWTAGVAASPLPRSLGTEVDRAGRAVVDSYLRLPGSPKVFVVGDAATVKQGDRTVPGVAQAAIQQGRYVGRLIARELAGKPTAPFQYSDRGNMAVVGKNFAILEKGRLRTSGFLTWLLWAVVHILALPQMQNRLRVQRQWLWSYLSRQRSSRLIVDPGETLATGHSTKQRRLAELP